MKRTPDVSGQAMRVASRTRVSLRNRYVLANLMQRMLYANTEKLSASA